MEGSALLRIILMFYPRPRFVALDYCVVPSLAFIGDLNLQGDNPKRKVAAFFTGRQYLYRPVKAHWAWCIRHLMLALRSHTGIVGNGRIAL